MSQKQESLRRTPWVSFMVALSMPGMGQVYNGDPLKGISLFIIFNVLYVIGFRWTVLLPDPFLIFGVLGTLGVVMLVYSIGLIDAFRSSKKMGIDSQSIPQSRWYFYLAIWLLGSGIVLGTLFSYIKKDVIEAFKIPSLSMEPTVLKGDRVFADKTAYRRIAPKKNDVIVFSYPNDRSKVFMKRIEGLPGDLIERANGKKETVPNGQLFVLGDNLGHSVDSRTFGFVPLRDVIGKVRQVYFSFGSDGIRWRRIGRVINH